MTFTGDIVEALFARCCGDVRSGEWGTTLGAIRAFDLAAIARGCGHAMIGSGTANGALDWTKDVARADDEARGIHRPCIWTAQRYLVMWAAFQK